MPQIASRYVEHPASGITPNRAAQCLRGAERGDLIAQSDLAADIEEKDTHLFAELGKRRLAIQGVPWSIEPPPNASANEKKDAEMLDEYLHSADWFDAMLFDATDAILKGYSCMEIEHGMLGKMHIIRAIRWRDSGHFCLNPDDLSELRLRDGSHSGVAFQPFGWIVHQSRSRTGYGGATGLVRTLIWPFIFKNYSVRDLAEFLEVYGLPMKVGKYPSGATPEQKSALMRAVMDIGRRTGGIIPAGMSLEFQAAANGQADPFETMISWGERSISKAILGGTLTTEAGDKGARSLGEVHNEVRREIRDSDLRDAILKGYSCMEIEHGMLGKMHIIRAIRWRDSGHFCLNPDDLSELRLRDGSHAGVAFQPFGWIVHQSRSRTGYGGATGLVRTLIWPFIFKNYSVRDLAEFLEVYGLPMKVGKYPSGATPEQKSALMRAVMDIGRRTGGIIPAGMSLEFQAAANGQADPFETMISWGERSISKAILGGTLTTEAGDKGARSLGEVHNEVRREIRDSDLRQLAATLNRDLVYPLYALNTTHTIDIRRLPRICFQTKEPGDITKITSAVMQLSTGMDISDPWIREQTGIPQPTPGEAIFRVRQSGNEPAQTDRETPPEKQEKTEQTALSARLPEAKSTPRDELDDMGDAVPARRLQEAIDPVLEPVIDAIRTRGLADALADLPALYREMDDSRLMTLLSDAMFAAEMKGMLDGSGD
ncbi:phage portal protein family protein [Shigella sonnei]